MNLKYIIIDTSKPTIHKYTTNIPYINQSMHKKKNKLENINQVPLKFHFDNVQIKDRFIYLHNCTEEGKYGGGEGGGVGGEELGDHDRRTRSTNCK